MEGGFSARGNENSREHSSDNELWADCNSLEGDAALDLDLDGGFDDYDFTDELGENLFEEMMIPAVAESALEQQSRISDPPPVSLPLPPDSGPAPESLPAIPETDAILNHGSLPKFTRLDHVVERASLTHAENQDIMSDLHGITEGLSNLSMADSKARPPRPTVLLRLEDELSKLPTERRAAYCQAVIKCPGMVSDERKMVFLDREDGDPALAADRLAQYWDLRLDFFGPERCFLPMTLNGAMRGELVNMISRPVYHLLPVKDAAGRAILYFDPSHRDLDNYSVDQELMSLWYHLEVAMEDPGTLKRGLVLVTNWKNAEMKHIFPKGEQQKGRIWLIHKAMPMYFRAGHYCHPNMVFYFLLPIFLHQFGRTYRQRFILHRGSEAEVLQELEGFCLPKACLPKDLGGVIVLDQSAFLAYRMALESSRPDPRLVLDQTPVFCPTGPASKRSRGTSASGSETVPKQKVGRKSDPRMDQAVNTRLKNPDVSLEDCLRMAGFAFDFKDECGEPIDADKISLTQRKNQLSRRVRQEKTRREEAALELAESSNNRNDLAMAARIGVGGSNYERRDSLRSSGGESTHSDFYYDSMLEMPGTQ